MNKMQKTKFSWKRVLFVLWLLFSIAFFCLLIFYVPTCEKKFWQLGIAVPLPTELAIRITIFFRSMLGIMAGLVILAGPIILYIYFPKDQGITVFFGILALVAFLACSFVFVSMLMGEYKAKYFNFSNYETRLK